MPRRALERETPTYPVRVHELERWRSKAHTVLTGLLCEKKKKAHLWREYFGKSVTDNLFHNAVVWHNVYSLSSKSGVYEAVVPHPLQENVLKLLPSVPRCQKPKWNKDSRISGQTTNSFKSRLWHCQKWVQLKWRLCCYINTSTSLLTAIDSDYKVFLLCWLLRHCTCTFKHV